MADNTSTAKHSPTKANNVITDMKNNSALRTRRTMACAYGFTFAFVLCTVILVFNPSAAYSSPWFHNVFRTNSDPSPSSSSSSSSSSSGSHSSSIFSYFFPQTPHSPPPFSAPLENTRNFSSSPNTTFQFSRGEEGVSNGTKDAPSHFSGKKEGILDDNKNTTSHNFSSPSNTTIQFSQGKEGVSNGTRDTPSQFSGKKEGILDDNKNTTSHNFSSPPNTTIQFSRGKGRVSNGTIDTPSQFSGKKEALLDGSKGTTSHNFSSSPNTTSQFSRGKGGVSNGTKGTPSQFSGDKEGFLMSREGINRSGSGDWKAKQRKEFDHCDIFDGKWVKDDLYPLYEAGSCPHIDEPFNCFLNGRPDAEYQKYRWQPNDCNIPRLNGTDMLGLLRGKRLVFVGDSLNRNMWESLVCILRNSVKDKSRVFEASGRREFRTEGSYSFVFEDYDCSVEFFRSPFLVQEWEMADTNGSTQETLRLDVIERSSDRYKTADVLIFNTGHWWTHEKTSKGKGYYQEGSHIYGQLNVAEAFRKAMTTWARWVDANINPLKTLVFFRGYSASHFRGGWWNSGGQCDSETEPIKNETYLAKYPSKMRVLESVMKGMKTPVFYLNITRITDYRKDAHPSIFRKQSLTEEERRSPLRYQDCSHWCLPGVPDTWNELLYAQLLIKHDQKVQNQQQQQQKRP